MSDTRAFYSKVRGLQAEGRYRYVRGAQPGEVLYMHREPKNPGDPNAIMLFRNRRVLLFFRWPVHIGYLSREIAEEFAPMLDQGFDFDVRVEEVTGTRTRPGLNISITYNVADKHIALARLKKYGQRGAIKRSREERRERGAGGRGCRAR